VEIILPLEAADHLPQGLRSIDNNILGRENGMKYCQFGGRLSVHPLGSLMYFFFDTETNGLPRNYKAPVTDLRNWPRLVQLAWLLTDAMGNEVTAAEYLVKPDGFIIPSEAVQVHGITTEKAQREGIALQIVLAEAVANIQRASVLVAHNMQFDEKILGAELLRLGQPNLVASKERRCTMQAATNFCRIPGPYGYKWPTLPELHQKLFKKPFAGEHQALNDVHACSRCFFELRRHGVVT
jgi:DNA polymerase III epsilon subunit-like protein